MSSRIFRHTIRVPYANIDKMGFVYYAHYLMYFEMARAQLMREAGIPYSELEDRGVLLPVVTAHCDYKKAARYDDMLLVLSRCSEIRGMRLHIDYEIKRVEAEDDEDGELLCTGFTDHICMSVEGKPMKPVDEIRKLVEGQKEEEADG